MALLDPFRRLASYLREATLPGTGNPSSTKLVYLTAGLGGVAASLALTTTLCVVYWRHHVVDASFAAAMSASWVTTFGFSSVSQNKKNAHEADIAMADAGAPPA